MPVGIIRKLACPLWLALPLLAGSGALADETLYRYEGDVFPDAADWEVFNPCEDECSRSIEDGHFVLHWTEASDLAVYNLRLALPPEPSLPSLWVEWRFRSNHPIGPNSFTCDAFIVCAYVNILSDTDIYGDTAITDGGSTFISGYDINEFHTFRFKSLDGINFTIALDGEVWATGVDLSPGLSDKIQFGGHGGCISDQFPNMINEWDFVRYGTIASGERVVSADPPSGLLDVVENADLDRFAITFDQANFVYIDEITVEVSSGTAPVITQTWRRDNEEPDTLEVVLNAPLDTNALTRFIISDGVSTSVIEYSYSSGDFGACCQDGGICTSLTADGCALIDGATFLGVGTECSGDTDDNGTDDACDSGACCLVGGSCTESFRLTCEAITDASFKPSASCQGDNNENGIDDRCEEPIPAVSAWGLLVLIAAVLVLGTLIIKQQPNHSGS